MGLQKDGTFLIEDAQLIWRNFSGKEGMYNREGNREFSVVLRPEDAQELIDAGWNVKELRVREEGDEPGAYVTVSVSFKTRPPKIIQVTSRGRTSLGEGEVELLDFVEIETVDLILTPYDWAVSGKSGRKAYLKSMYITIVEDPLDLKYALMDEAARED